jgi:hypothetical protein
MFRGMVDSSWPLRTSIQRLGSPPDIVEVPLLRNFRKYSDPAAFYRDSIWELMSVAQHNGLPTRILDWTVSPLIACHFATDDSKYKNVDGVVWCVNAADIRKSLPKELIKILSKEIAWIFDTPMLDKVVPTLKKLDREKFSGTDFVLIFEPPSIHQRIINQHGLLSVANGVEKNQDDIFTRSGGAHPALRYRSLPLRRPARLAHRVRSHMMRKRDNASESGPLQRSVHVRVETGRAPRWRCPHSSEFLL